MHSRGIGGLNRNVIIIDKKSGTGNEWNLDFISLLYFHSRKEGMAEGLIKSETNRPGTNFV